MILPLAVVAVTINAVGALGPPGIADQPLIEGFETGLGAWTTDSFIEPGGPQPLDPTFTRTQDRAHSGVWSLDIGANGLNDDGTVWIERSVALPPGAYDVSLSYWLWSPNEGTIGAWDTFGFIGVANPENESDIIDHVLGPCGQAAGWFRYEGARRLTAGVSGELWLAVGLNIVFESINTHGFDDITITAVPRCRADSDADGRIGPADVALFVTAWFGSVQQGTLAGDFDRDGAVLPADLAMFVGEWFTAVGVGCP